MKPKKRVSVSELKVHALQIIESMKHSKEEVEVYKRGKLVARIVPASATQPKPFLNRMPESVDFLVSADSLLEPIDEVWNASRDEDSF